MSDSESSNSNSTSSRNGQMSRKIRGLRKKRLYTGDPANLPRPNPSSPTQTMSSDPMADGRSDTFANEQTKSRAKKSVPRKRTSLKRKPGNKKRRLINQRKDARSRIQNKRTRKRVKPRRVRQPSQNSALAVMQSLIRPLRDGLRQVGAEIAHIWAIATRIDSYLWRGIRAFYRVCSLAITTIADWIISAIIGFVRWLPTRAGQGYCAFAAIIAIVGGLWIAEEVRGTSLSVQKANASISTKQAARDARDPVMARIGGDYIRLSTIQTAAHIDGSLAPDEDLIVGSEKTRELVNSYVDQRLLVRAAAEDNLVKDAILARRLTAARERLLAAAYLEKIVALTVTPERVEKLYAAQSDITALGEEVRARHILVGTRADAVDIILAIDRGADFSTLARARSLDRGTAPHGGDMGFITRDMVSDEFGRIAFSIDEGALSLPFKTDQGWNIVEILEKRQIDPVEFTSVAADLERFLTLRTIEQTLSALKQQYEVVIVPHGNEQ